MPIIMRRSEMILPFKRAADFLAKYQLPDRLSFWSENIENGRKMRKIY
jgi:hypothetical protein